MMACNGTDPKTDEPDNPDIPETPELPQEGAPAGWKLVWQDLFDGKSIDSTVWSRIPKGSPDWAKAQSLDDRCYEKTDTSIILRGIVNSNNPSDSRPYICGGIWTLGKKSFAPGRIEVRARMTAAQGAWPAIWMMPFKSEKGWPYDGEIDIMERLNHDTFVYQTVHSGYIDVDGNRTNPQYSTTPRVPKPDEFHVYGVEIYGYKVVFLLDGKETLTYDNKNISGQFPFYRDWDLRLDMQLGGSWVGNVNLSSLPVEMEIDYVKYYERIK